MVKYVDPNPPIPEEPARQMVETLEQDGPMKPWTLLSRIEVNNPEIDARIDVLKPLTLRGVLTINADGDVRIYNRGQLENEVTE